MMHMATNYSVLSTVSSRVKKVASSCAAGYTLKKKPEIEYCIADVPSLNTVAVLPFPWSRAAARLGALMCG